MKRASFEITLDANTWVQMEKMDLKKDEFKNKEKELKIQATQYTIDWNVTDPMIGISSAWHLAVDGSGGTRETDYKAQSAYVLQRGDLKNSDVRCIGDRSSYYAEFFALEMGLHKLLELRDDENNSKVKQKTSNNNRNKRKLVKLDLNDDAAENNEKKINIHFTEDQKVYIYTDCLSLLQKLKAGPPRVFKSSNDQSLWKLLAEVCEYYDITFLFVYSHLDEEVCPIHDEVDALTRTNNADVAVVDDSNSFKLTRREHVSKMMNRLQEDQQQQKNSLSSVPDISNDLQTIARTISSRKKIENLDYRDVKTFRDRVSSWALEADKQIKDINNTNQPLSQTKVNKLAQLQKQINQYNSLLLIPRKLPLRLRYTNLPPLSVRKWFWWRCQKLLQARAGNLWITRTDWSGEGNRCASCRFCETKLHRLVGDHSVYHFMFCSGLVDERKTAFTKNKIFTDIFNSRKSMTEKNEKWKEECMNILWDPESEIHFVDYVKLAEEKNKKKNSENEDAAQKVDSDEETDADDE